MSGGYPLNNNNFNYERAMAKRINGGGGSGGGVTQEEVQQMIEQALSSYDVRKYNGGAILDLIGENNPNVVSYDDESLEYTLTDDAIAGISAENVVVIYAQDSGEWRRAYYLNSINETAAEYISLNKYNVKSLAATDAEAFDQDRGLYITFEDNICRQMYYGD